MNASKLLFIALIIVFTKACVPSDDQVPADQPSVNTVLVTPISTGTAISERPSISGSELNGGEPTDETSQSGCESNPHPVFSSPFTDLSMIRFISPLGVISHSIIHHSYVWIGDDPSGDAYEVPIYAPVDSWLTRASYYSQPMQGEDGGWQDVAQYFVWFDVSCEVNYKFAHVDRLVDELATVVPSDPADTSRTVEVSPPVFVHAGDLIGYTRGTITANNWDFGVYNRSRTNQFASQARYEETWDLNILLYADCPYDYFEGELRRQIYSLLPEGECGSASGDVLSTIAGAWFESPEIDPMGHGSDLDVGQTQVPGGEFVIVRTTQSELRVCPEQATYLPPAMVTAEHCYVDCWDPSRFVYLKLISEMELAVAFGTGDCPSEIPADYKAYYR